MMDMKPENSELVELTATIVSAYVSNNTVVAGTGTDTIYAAGNSLTFDGGGDKYIFNGSVGGGGSTSLVGQSWQLNNTTVENLGNFDNIDITDILESDATLSYLDNGNNTGVLTVASMSDPSIFATMALIGQYSQSGFQLGTTGSDTLVTYNTAITTAYDNPFVAPSHPTV